MDFRLYDNALGRFFGIDALSEQNHYLSTYQFGDGNPVVFSDPTGLDSQTDMFGRDRFDRWGMFIPWADRGPMTSSIDAGNSSGGSGGGTTIGSFEALQHFGILLASNPNNRNIQFRGNSDGTFTVTWTETIIRGTGQFYTNELGTTHEEMEFQYIDHTTAASGNGGGASLGMPDWMKTANTGIGAFGVGNGLKDQLFDYAVRTNYRSARTYSEFNNLRQTQKNWRYNHTLGKTGANYLKYSKGLGVVGAGLSTTYSIMNATSYYKNGGQNWEVGAKATLDIIMTGVGFLGPVGFGISATYFILDAATDGFGGFGSTD
jgi:hypothetical protein